MQSIEIDDVTYAFDPMPTAATEPSRPAGREPPFTYDPGSQTLTVDTDPSSPDGEFAIVMTTGDFTFQAAADFTTETFDFVLADNDSDTAGNRLRLIATGDVPPIVRDDRVFTHRRQRRGDRDPGPCPAPQRRRRRRRLIAVTRTALAQDGSVRPASADPITTLRLHRQRQRRWSASSTPAAPSRLPRRTRASCSSIGDQTGTTLDGTGLDEILIGRDGSDNTINAFEGNDVLIGCTGDDILNPAKAAT